MCEGARALGALGEPGSLRPAAEGTGNTIKATIDDFGSQYLAVYLDGEKVERCLFADDERGLVEIHEPRWATAGESTFRHGRVEFRLAAGTSPEMQAALERHYGRRLVREA